MGYGIVVVPDGTLGEVEWALCQDKQKDDGEFFIEESAWRKREVHGQAWAAIRMMAQPKPPVQLRRVI